MDDRLAVAWLHRRGGLGLHPDQLAAAALRGPVAELDRMIDPRTVDRAPPPSDPPPDPPPDPWAGVDLDPDDGGRRRAVAAWMQHLASTEQPYADRRTWLLHGWLVSSLAKVTVPEMMVDQIRLLMRAGGGSYADLLRDVTVDRAMLVYLDGRTSTGEAPNENYGRELLELFALGVGNYTEADVRATARALTGWVAGRETGAAVFVPRRHDDTPQTLLGADGVHDVDTVIDAVVAHPAHARFVAERITREYLGDPGDPALDGVVEVLATTYVDAGFRLDAVIRRALELGLEGASTPLVTAPVPWFVRSSRVTGAPPSRLGADAADRIRETGQLPLLPPDVSGWPEGTAWFTASSLIARTHVAAALSAATPAGAPLRVSVEDGDLDRVAEQLGLPEPFSPATVRALRRESDPTDRLALALVSPEHLLS